MKRIPINIWDDYWEDGYVPENEIQETYMYVEDTDIPELLRKTTLEYINDYILGILKVDDFQTKLYYYDSAKKYPNLIGTENESMLFKRWELRLYNITHERRYKLLEQLNKANLEFNSIPIEFYSES